MLTTSQFGVFFRSKRKALGLTLREFCRRNGFDPGNVSRLERGLAAPPQMQEGLESYAKALKIERGKDEWKTFLELAAAETGRIPVADQARIRELPKLLRKLRRESPVGNWVRAIHLQAWADSMEARELLPQLVRRLVNATGKGVVRMGPFPAREQVQRPGWDGIVEATEIDSFVPAGVSVWEMGVDKEPEKKAERDLAKRNKDPLGVDPKDTVFVFVTPRKWQKSAEWCKKKMELGVWKELRVYDSALLEEWLERSLAVDAWLAQMLGQKPSGLVDIEEYWKNLQALTEPCLTPAVFLTSREDAIAEMTKWLEGPPTAIEVEARSPTDVIDFFAAYSRDPLKSDLLASKVLIVEEKQAWRAVAGVSDQELLLIAHPSLAVEPEMMAEAVRKGHRVLLPSTESPGKSSLLFKLPRTNRYELQKALVSCGLKEVDAERGARESGGSLTVLKRRLGRFPATIQPTWTLPANAQTFIPVLLAGGWDENSEGDRAALEELSERPYGEFSIVASEWLNTADSPLMRIGSRWKLVSRDDSWMLLAGSLNLGQLARFEKVALEVLGENDPALALSSDERWQANFYHKTLRFSSTLRTGLSETLALLAVKESSAPQLLIANGRVERVVRVLLENQGWERWASLSYLLPILAEASPEGFLAAVEKDLSCEYPALIKIFEQEGDAMFSSSPHTGLLWALEGLVWIPSLLSRVSLILASLEERTTPGRLSNRPLKCLQEIFLPWLPQTTANVEERVKVLKHLVRKKPNLGWRLLTGLLPNNMQASSPIHSLMWRDLPYAWTKGVTNAEYWYQVNACADLLVQNMGTDLERWKALIEQFENLPETAGTEFLKRLNEFDVNVLDASSRRAITEAFREKVWRHSKYAEADWALPGELLCELEKVQSRFEPEDVVVRNAWLFGESWSVEEKLDGEPAKLPAIRGSVIREILSQAGWEGILRLAELAPSALEVGWVLGEEGTEDRDRRILPEMLTSNDEKMVHFALGYAKRRFKDGAWTWIASAKTDAWSDQALGLVLVNLWSGEKPWEFAANRPGVVRYYWENAPLHSCQQIPEELTFVISMLLKHHRPWAACNVLTMSIHQKMALHPSMIMEVLEAGMNAEMDENAKGAGGDLRYKTHLLFQELQRALIAGDTRVDEKRLAGLEWAYVGVLDGYPATPVTLHRLLRDNADFFVEVLGLAFRRKEEPVLPEGEFSEEHKARAQNSYRLLASWHLLPGSQLDSTVDGEALRGWVQKARRIAKEKGLLEICDSRIGGVLAHDLERAGEAWPSDAVKDALEEIGTEEVFDGFRVGVYNKRGAYRKSMDEGGNQERSIAKKYHDFADACSIEWPKTAAALRYLAQGYEENAKREDVEVQARW